jgi:UDPglucose 6-dehydrogenase
LAKAGHNVSGVDLSKNRINDILRLNIEPEPKVSDHLSQVLNNTLRVSSEFAGTVEKSEVSFLIVPTPSSKDGKFINDYIEEAIESLILNVKSENHLICIVSTVMPGTCDKIINDFIPSKLNNSKTKFKIAYSPEFVALGTVIDNMQKPDMILIGANDDSVIKILEPILKSIAINSPEAKKMSLASSELAKISVNTFVTAKISYANMIAELAEKIPGANKHDILDALGADTRISSKYLKPGLGFGGPCFPRDNKAFSVIGDSLSINTELAKATQTINLRQPKIVAERINSKFLNDYSELTVLGLSYKPGSFVTEESQAVMLVNELSKKWMKIKVHDPLVSDKDLFRKIKNISYIDAISKIKKTDLVIIAVNWAEYLEVIRYHPKENLYFV